MRWTPGMIHRFLVDAVGIGLHQPIIKTGLSCLELQNTLWSCYVSQRRDGLRPMYVRRAQGFTVRIYRFHCYVVKEYTGQTRKVASEIEILQQLNHHTLLGHLFIVDEGARLSVVMDWAGDNLRIAQQQQQELCLDEDVARHIALQLTHSLVYLHEKGIIHRDIKPDNVAIRPDLSVKLFDWSEALVIDKVQLLTDRQLAKTVDIAGTPLFMPPEVLLFLTHRSELATSRTIIHASSNDSTTIYDNSPQHKEQLLPGTATAVGCSCWGLQASTSRSRQPCQQQDSPAGALAKLLSPKLDVWGMGTVIYFLLSGRDILAEDCGYELEDIANIFNASHGIKLPAHVRVSTTAREFLARCLERDPAKRASAKDLLAHPWLSACDTGTLLAQKAAAHALDHRESVDTFQKAGGLTLGLSDDIIKAHK